ncbi:MAG: tetratricopeptide repeat protein [Candidatus Brocadiaceae bacterium]|nr:tetratricopeptide repeat protein [Candidatus Brocadiaceae bacterium]
MKKYLFLQILLIAFLLISFELPSYGSGNFTKYYNEGIEFYKQGKYDQAGKEFEKAIELKPNDVYALYGLGNTYYCKSKYDDAVKVYTKAININPDYAKVHYSLSLAYSKLGKTREAEKQKSIFRKLSQGGGSSQTHAKSAHTSTHSSSGHTPKKALSYTPKKSMHESKHAVTHDTGHGSKHATTHDTGHESKHATTHDAGHENKHATTHDTGHGSKHVTTHDTGHESKHATTHDTGHGSKHATTHDTGHESKHSDAHGGGGDSHSIFKGYSDETHKADDRVFKKKQHKKFVYGDYKNPLSSVKYFVQNKWYSSRIHKIWICAAGYIFATQAWLCVVAFFCVIVWRIRERD